MKKKSLLITSVIVILLVIGYGVGIGYYADRFQPNTNFAGIDLSNQTKAQAKEEMTRYVTNRTFTVKENGKDLGTFKLGDFNPKFNVDTVLDQVYQSQNPNLWPVSFFTGANHDVQLTEYLQFDQAEMNQKLKDLGLDNDKRTAAEAAKIEYTEAEGYHIVHSKPGDKVDFDRLAEVIAAGIKDGQDSIDVKAAYQEPAVKDDDERLAQSLEAIDQASAHPITVEVAGHKEVADQKKIQSWIAFDGENKLVYDPARVATFVDELNKKYATFNKPREFKSTMRGTVTVEPGTLGWSIDKESEVKRIIDDLKAGRESTHEASIVGSGYGSGGDDIGNTYIEVDLSNQKMFYYHNGELVFQTDIVSGQVGTDTVPGAYSVWNKESPSNLKGHNPRTGQDYTQPVQYWMAFDDTGQGIHDANWQSSFGGNTFTVSGSLGCINTPPASMAELYGQADLGTPVIVF